MSNNPITFVTSYYHIYENDKLFNDKTIEWRFNQFKDIASTGINICLYTDKICYEHAEEFIKEYPNIKLMSSITDDLTNTTTYKSIINCDNIEYTLPENRHPTKDTAEYMILMNTKIEFMNNAIQQNPFHSSHFAWIDFSISYIFKNKENTLDYLKSLNQKTILSNNQLIMPGCQPYKLKCDDTHTILNNIYWRFCGGFFIGDSSSINELFNLYQTHFANFCKINKKIVWEVNFWAWLEANTEWKPIWYYDTHTDNIICIPDKYIS